MRSPDPCVSRRLLLSAGAAGLSALLLPAAARRAGAQAPRALGENARLALGESTLVYVSPLRSDGAESRCHGEVWFVPDGIDERLSVLVVTAPDRWKARALARGLTRARLWVGDFGVSTRSGDRFRSAPSFTAEAAFEREAAVRQRALEAFGVKYSNEWSTWGPRFRSGLADGSRVMIRYKPAPG